MPTKPRRRSAPPMDALPTEVATLHAALRLSRAQCADLHRQPQGMVPQAARDQGRS
jgi:hypothetical protein